MPERKRNPMQARSGCLFLKADLDKEVTRNRLQAGLEGIKANRLRETNPGTGGEDRGPRPGSGFQACPQFLHVRPYLLKGPEDSMNNSRVILPRKVEVNGRTFIPGRACLDRFKDILIAGRLHETGYLPFKGTF